LRFAGVVAGLRRQDQQSEGRKDEDRCARTGDGSSRVSPHLTAEGDQGCGASADVQPQVAFAPNRFGRLGRV
jgi:hypothetical protein